MSSFYLELAIPKSPFMIHHGEEFVLQGSCFSDEISKQLINAGHTISDATFGTIFHPTMLAINILNCLEDNVDERIFQREELFFSWNCSSTVFSYAAESLKEKLEITRKKLRKDLLSAKILIVTFGSAWGYELIKTNELVADCHKMPQKDFRKFLSSPYEMVQDWIYVIEKLKTLNPNMQILFTVSPVRHIKDGLVENNLSKSRLIEVVQQLVLEENCHYFPSYELLIDVLRDYRFYASDKIHPSEEAIEYIWNKFQETYFSNETIELNRKVRGIRKSMNHRSLHGETMAQLKYLENIRLKLEEIKITHPEIKW